MMKKQIHQNPTLVKTIKSFLILKSDIRSSLTLFFAITLSIQSYAQIKPLTSKQIDSLVDKSMKLMPLAGVAIAVVKDGKVIHAKGYGVNSIQTKEKTDENSLFAIASNSKAFTTMALAILVDEGKIKWQAPSWWIISPNLRCMILMLLRTLPSLICLHTEVAWV